MPDVKNCAHCGGPGIKINPGSYVGKGYIYCESEKDSCPVGNPIGNICGITFTLDRWNNRPGEAAIALIMGALVDREKARGDKLERALRNACVDAENRSNCCRDEVMASLLKSAEAE